jgi:putative transposase
MARRQRFHQSLTLYHVMLRGNDGQPIFFEEEDKERLCHLLREGINRFGHLIHAFCFMKNHIHLAVQVQEIPLSRIMQNVAFRYSQYINKKYDRIGHLFQGRFKAIVVDGEGYFNELVRYIHLNPVRAGLVDSPEKYKWSSHNAYLLQEQESWITTKVVLKKFGNSIPEALNRYLSFIHMGIGVESKINFKSGISKGVVGDESFVDQCLEKPTLSRKKDIALADLVELVSNYCNVPAEILRGSARKKTENHARALLALLARESKNLSIEELAAYLNREPSGISKIATRLEKESLQSSDLQKQIQDLKDLIASSKMSGSQA